MQDKITLDQIETGDKIHIEGYIEAVSLVNKHDIIYPEYMEIIISYKGTQLYMHINPQRVTAERTYHGNSEDLRPRENK